MPIPASINDLSTTAASNSPPGSEAPTTFDDYLRVYASYIASLRDAALSGTGNISTVNITYTGTLTGSTGVLNIGAGQVYKSATGNVGIGTITPSAKLEVVGSAYIKDRVTLQRTTGSAWVDAMQFGDTLGGARTDNISIGNGGGGDVLVHTNGSERVRVDSNGNIKIFNTASAPGTPTGGGILYVQAGALKYIGSSGTITTLAAA